MTAARTLRSAATLTTVLLVAMTAACSSRQGPAKPPYAGAIPKAVDIAGLHLPIEKYMLTSHQSADFDRVSDAAVRACMRRFAVAYPAATSSGPDRRTIDAYTVMYRRYGVTDAKSVRTWGYHVPGDRPPGSVVPARQRQPLKLPPASQRVLTGVDTSGRPVVSYNGLPLPQDGCLGEAERLLGGSSPQGPGTDPGGIASQIKAESFARSMADPRVTKVFAKWSDCMKFRGFHMSGPMDDVASIDAPTPSRKEIAEAQADVACKARTDLVGVWFAVESAYQKAAIAANQAAFDRVGAARDATVRNINQLAGTYRGGKT